jgi:hypothetical protein
MDLHRDFANLCSLLNANGVDFLIVGGYAVAFHGAPRFTGDLDILIYPALEQVQRTLTAVKQFGFPAEQIDAQDVLQQRRILQLGRQPVQIHVMTSISGVSWDSAWESRQAGSYGNVPVFFIGRDALLANKRAAGRAKDLADVEALRPSHYSEGPT